MEKKKMVESWSPFYYRKNGQGQEKVEAVKKALQAYLFCMELLSDTRPVKAGA